MHINPFVPAFIRLIHWIIISIEIQNGEESEYSLRFVRTQIASEFRVLHDLHASHGEFNNREYTQFVARCLAEWPTEWPDAPQFQAARGRVFDEYVQFQTCLFTISESPLFRPHFEEVGLDEWFDIPPDRSSLSAVAQEMIADFESAVELGKEISAEVAESIGHAVLLFGLSLSPRAAGMLNWFATDDSVEDEFEPGKRILN